MDDFPIIDRHCGVGIHDFQTPARIATIVKPAIAAVAGMNDVFGLADYAANYLKPPEARLFAAAKVEAAHAIATDERRVRPDVDLEKVRASVAGLRDLRWSSLSHYCSAFDVWGPGRPAADERPAEERARLEEARRTLLI
ncbi:MAG: hypothetical protein U1E28_21915 [Beijerinckiaceae bacterium]